MARDSPKKVSVKKSEILQGKEENKDFIRGNFFRINCGDAMVGFFVCLRIFPASHTAACDSTYSAAARSRLNNIGFTSH